MTWREVTVQRGEMFGSNEGELCCRTANCQLQSKQTNLSALAEQDAFCMKFLELKKHYQEIELVTEACHLPAWTRYLETSDTQQS